MHGSLWADSSSQDVHEEDAMRKVTGLALFAVLLIAVVVGRQANLAGAADHLDAPLVDADGRIDITDVYAFTHGTNTVLVMNVNPFAGVLSPTTFRPDAEYAFRIDNTGDAV